MILWLCSIQLPAVKLSIAWLSRIGVVRPIELVSWYKACQLREWGTLELRSTLWEVNYSEKSFQQIGSRRVSSSTQARLHARMISRRLNWMDAHCIGHHVWRQDDEDNDLCEDGCLWTVTVGGGRAPTTWNCHIPWWCRAGENKTTLVAT